MISIVQTSMQNKYQTYDKCVICFSCSKKLLLKVNN